MRVKLLLLLTLVNFINSTILFCLNIRFDVVNIDNVLPSQDEYRITSDFFVTIRGDEKLLQLYHNYCLEYSGVTSTTIQLSLISNNSTVYETSISVSSVTAVEFRVTPSLISHELTSPTKEVLGAYTLYNSHFITHYTKEGNNLNIRSEFRTNHLLLPGLHMDLLFDSAYNLSFTLINMHPRVSKYNCPPATVCIIPRKFSEIERMVPELSRILNGEAVLTILCGSQGDCIFFRAPTGVRQSSYSFVIALTQVGSSELLGPSLNFEENVPLQNTFNITRGTTTDRLFELIETITLENTTKKSLFFSLSGPLVILPPNAPPPSPKFADLLDLTLLGHKEKSSSSSFPQRKQAAATESQRDIGITIPLIIIGVISILCVVGAVFRQKKTPLSLLTRQGEELDEN